MIDTLYKIVRFVARFAVFIIALVALLGALVVAVTQVKSFRTWALGKGLAALNNELQARIEIGDVTGNFITGLTLHDVRVIAAGTTMIESPTVELHYQLRPFFTQQVVGAKAYLYNPTIRLIRSRTDSTWNYEHITKPAVDSVKTPFNWTIDVAAFEIQNGTVFMHDLTQPPDFDTVSRRVNYSYLDLQNANVALQAHVEPTTQSVWIQHISFDAPQPDIRLLELAANITVDTTGLSVRDFRLETERTQLALSGHVDSVNFLGVQKAVTPFKEHPVSLEVDAERVSTLELKRFLPGVAFLDGTPSLKLSASGTLANLMVNYLHLGLDQDSRLNIAGRLQNLDEPDKLFLDLKLNDTRLSDLEVRKFVPGLQLPDLRYLGNAEIRQATFVGEPQNFTATIDASTAVGAAKGGVKLDLRGRVMQYTGDVAIIHGNFAPILKDPSLESDFTGRAVINGRGVTLGELNAKVRLESQSSTIAGRSYRKLYFDGAARDGGYLQIDTLLVDFGPKGTVNQGAYDIDTLAQPYSKPDLQTVFREPLRLDDADRQLFASGPFFGASGWLDMRNRNLPRYNLNVRGRDFNVADVVPDNNPTRMTFTMQATGAGFRLDDLEGKGNLVVTRAEIPGKSIPPFNATYTLQRQDARHRTLDLTSTFADIKISGEWRPEAVIPALTEGIQSVTEYIRRKVNFEPESYFALKSRPFNESIDAHYDIVLRDLAPVGLFLSGADLQASGTIGGDITGTPQLLSISTQGRINTLSYRADSLDLSLDSTTIDASLHSITPGRIGELMTAEITVRSDSAVRFNDISFRAPQATIGLQYGVLTMHGATAINDQFSIGIDGTIDVNNPSGYRANIDTMIVGLSNGMRWRNIGALQATLGKDRITLDSFAVQRRNAEVVSITGTIAGERFENVQITAQRGSLKAIPQLIGATGGIPTIDPMAGLVRDLSFRVNGTFQQPLIDGNIVIDSLSYSGNPIGDLRATLSYRDRNLTGLVSVVNAPLSKVKTDSALTIDIASFPIDLALASRSERLITGGEVMITAHSKDLSIAPAEPFLSGVRIKGGTADANFTVSGSFPDLVYAGGARISNGRLLVEGNNILYLLPSAELEFKESKLTIKNTVLRNDPRDYPRGAARVDGAITFDGFTISNLDINVQTNGLLVLSDATQAVNDVVYGDLVIASEGGPIRFSGPLKQPSLTGNVTVVLGDLFFPESRGKETNTNVVKYIDYSDWIKRASQQYGPVFPSQEDTVAQKGDTVRRQRDTVVAPQGSLPQQAEELTQQIETVKGTQTGGNLSLADQIIFDLWISIPGRLFMKMKFSSVEDLDAEIATSAPLQFRRGPDGQSHLIGEVSVLEGSRYNFFRTFDASGSLRFRDNIDSVGLDLLATYNGRTFGQNGEIVHEYQVIIRITGTKLHPKIDLTYTLDGRAPSDANPDERTRNAVSLLLFGRTANELLSSAQTPNTSLGRTAGSAAIEGSLALASSVSTSVLSELVGSSRFIRSIGVDLGGGQGGETGQARLSVISQFGQIILRYSGQISSPQNSVITIDIPFALISDTDFLRHIVGQLELENQESSGRTGSLANQSQSARARIQYRTSW
jgi:hypothetical protein